MPRSSAAAAAGVSNTDERLPATDVALIATATAGVADSRYGTGVAAAAGSVTAASPAFDLGDGHGAFHAVADRTKPDEATGDEPRIDVAPTDRFSTTVVNGFLARVSRSTNDDLVLHPVTRIGGEFSAKSVVASGTGLYFAQNMMYRHTISVLDHEKNLVATIDDSVDLKSFGYDVSGHVYRGAPVEAAFTSDGSFAFVSNYRMYGPGFDPQAGSDSCEKDQGQDSFVYRINTTTFDIDRVYSVGPVPKYLAVTPDDRLLLVSNWCGFDTSVIDLATNEILALVDVGRHPRGIAITSDSKTAYVAVMGSTDIAVIDLSALSLERNTSGTVGTSARSYLRDVGISPRHLVLSPDDETLYVTLNGEDAVVAVDLDSGQVIRRVRTGNAPRSMDISTDGTALYVVNYKSHTMSKIRTRDLRILQEFDTTPRPIGITYDPFNNEVWVSTYSGTIHVYAESE